MASIHDAFKDDDVNGTIIGDVKLPARLFYEDRPQSEILWFNTEHEAKVFFTCRVKELKEANHFSIYPNNTWTVRFLQ
jgi:hypothetical protein